MAKNNKLEKATFAAGCFWGVEEAFRNLKGVKSTTVGFTGGDFKDPTYKDVCNGKTGHAEAVEVQYDPNEVTYEKLLQKFWEIHDPTTPNRHPTLTGSQYRSIIFFQNEEQEKLAYTSKRGLEKSGRYSAPIVTEITEARTFYRAEDYHQQYIHKNGLSSCHT